MQRRESAHGQADDVGLVDLEAVEDGADIVAGARLGVSIHALRHVGGRKSAGVVGDAAIVPAEVAELGFPRPAIAGELDVEPPNSAVTLSSRSVMSQ